MEDGPEVAEGVGDMASIGLELGQPAGTARLRVPDGAFHEYLLGVIAGLEGVLSGRADLVACNGPWGTTERKAAATGPPGNAVMVPNHGRRLVAQPNGELAGGFRCQPW